MKWPNQLQVLRHGESEYNALHSKRLESEAYQAFRKQYFQEWNRLRKDPVRALTGDFPSPELIELTRDAIADITLPFTDFETPLTEEGKRQAVATGHNLDSVIEMPDVVMISPYIRTQQTYEGLCEGWPALSEIPTRYDGRIREQEHGLASHFSDAKIAHVFNPVEGLNAEAENRFHHRYLGGESMLDVQDRVGDVLSMLIREYSGQNVMMVTHHLLILAARSKLERWSPQEFLDNNDSNRPRNCSLTVFKGDPDLGQDGKLTPYLYNQVLWDH